MTITRKQIGHLAAEDRLDRRINGPGNPDWNPEHDPSGSQVRENRLVNGEAMGLGITTVL